MTKTKKAPAKKASAKKSAPKKTEAKKPEPIVETPTSSANPRAAEPPKPKKNDIVHPEDRFVDSPNGDLPADVVTVKTDDGTFSTEKDPNWDGFAALNGFVTVKSGDHAGKYGVANGVDHDGKVIVVTRDENQERITVDYSDLAPDRAGRR